MWRIPKNSILVEQVTGLGDRLAALRKAILLGRAINKQVYLSWPVNGAVGCRFEDLFEVPAELQLFDNPFERLRKWLGARKIRSSAAHRLLNATERRYFTYCHDYAFTPPRCCAPSLHELRAMSRIALKFNIGKSLADAGLIHEPLDWLRPVAPIRERIEEMTDQFTRPIIGIHVRRADVSRTSWVEKYVPEEEYISAMRQEIERDKAVSFYIASDSREMRVTFKNLFGDRVIMQPNVDTDRSSLEGMQCAVIDMFSLAQADTIWAGVSTFSGMAARIRRLNIGSESPNRRFGRGA